MITFSKGEELFGYNFSALVKFTAYVANGITPLKHTMDKLSIKSKKDYNNVIKTLIDNGYIVKEKRIVNSTNSVYSVTSPYTTTEKGKEFCRAMCAKRMTRSQADKIYSEILDRVREVNDNPYYLYKVNNIALFGSYITDKKDLGDIDIAFDFQFKHRIVETKNGLDSRINANQKRAHENNCYDFYKSLHFGLDEVAKFLKNRKTKIHITPYSHIDSLKGEVKKFPVK